MYMTTSLGEHSVANMNLRAGFDAFAAIVALEVGTA
jgi:molybdopterin-binding protein